MKTLTSKERDLIDKLIEKQNELTTLKLINWSTSEKRKDVQSKVKFLEGVTRLFKLS